MPTRSTKLASIRPAAGVLTQAFLVPAGYTYLLKSALAWNNGGGADNILCYLQDPAGIVSVLLSNAALPGASRLEWEGWAAANPGDQVIVKSTTGVTDFWLSGTKLPGLA